MLTAIFSLFPAQVEGLASEGGVIVDGGGEGGEGRREGDACKVSKRNLTWDEGDRGGG